MNRTEFYLEDAAQDWQEEYLEHLEDEYYRRFNGISSIAYETFDDLEKVSIPIYPRIMK